MRTRQWVQAVILLCLGLYFLDNMLSGRIYFYINERFGWLTWLGTIVILLIGVVSIVDLLHTRPELAHDHEHHDHDEHDGHDHDHIHEHDHEGHNHAPSWAKLAIVSVPLIVGLVVPAKPLGAAAIQNSGVSTSYSSQGTTSAMNVAPTDRNVLDWVRAFNSSTDVKEFEGQKADLIGFVYRDLRFDEKTQFMVARFAISCCVADASALGVIVQTTDAAKWAQDGWIHVRGKFQTQTLDDRATPILVADSIESVAQPDHPYLYP